MVDEGAHCVQCLTNKASIRNVLRKKLDIFPLETENPVRSSVFNTGLNIFCIMGFLFHYGFLHLC